jgi:uncharacterized protein YeaO (DUF488 family)
VPSHSNIQIKRVYEPAEKRDGYRVLVDRLWPRGIRKESARLDEWIKDLAPSTALRKWFHEGKGTFQEFAARYKREMAGQEAGLARLKELSKERKLTLLYGSRDEKQNHAVLLREMLGHLKV